MTETDAKATPDAAITTLSEMLCRGPDAEIQQRCSAIMSEFHDFMASRGNPDQIVAYEDACGRIEALAEEFEKTAATTIGAMRAKAEVVQTLASIGMAGYSHRILAASLARDVLTATATTVAS